jgi:hypothetical protein
VRYKILNWQIWHCFVSNPANHRTTRVYCLHSRLYQNRSQEAKCHRVWESFWEASVRSARELSANITRFTLNARQPWDRTNYTHFHFHSNSNSALVCHSTPARTAQITNIRTTQHTKRAHAMPSSNIRVDLIRVKGHAPINIKPNHLLLCHVNQNTTKQVASLQNSYYSKFFLVY